MRWIQNLLFVAAGLLLFLFALTAEADSPLPAEEPGGSILLLRSGEVLHGEISRLDERYLVVLPSGRIFVPEASVLIVCRSIEEAYQFKRTRVALGQAPDHARLAQWCQRNGLAAAAEEELRTAQRIDPDHPVVGLIERRLAAEKIVRVPGKAKPEDSPDTQPTARQLEDFAGGLPRGTVEAFTKVVQPLLLNRCATSGCHTDRSSNEFRLERPRSGFSLGHKSTHANLLATMKLVDRGDPSRSELLSPRNCPHRINTDATLSLSRSGQYRHLVAWVDAITKLQSRSTYPAIQTTEPSRSIADTGAGTSGEETANVSAASPSTAGMPLTIEPVKPVVRPLEQLPGTAPTAGDPFDPEIFNRKYGTSPPPTRVTR